MKRLPVPDLLKGLAIIFMIQVHITELFTDQAGRESIFGKISLFFGGPFTAMVFMIVMGYFMAANHKPLINNIFRGIKIIFLGILLNLGLNFHLLLKIIRDNWPYNPWEYIFGVDILFLAGLSMILLAFLRLVPQNKRGWLTLILILAIAGLTPFMNKNFMTTERNYLLPFIAGTYSWSYFPLFPWLIYPLSGFVFYIFEEKIRKYYLTLNLISATFLLVILTGIVWYFPGGFLTTINLSEYYHHSGPYSLWALGLVIPWAILIRLVHKLLLSLKVGQFLVWLGKNITLIYVVQWIIIGNIATAIYQTQSLKSSLLWFVLIFIVSAAISRFIEFQFVLRKQRNRLELPLKHDEQ